MNQRSHSRELVTALSILGAVVVLVTFFARSDVPPKTRHDPGVSFTATAPPVATTASPRITEVPDIEALIPLSVATMRDDVAQSVGFVLSEHGTGSGVVISDDLMVTNAHVVWPDPSVSVVFQNGSLHQGRVVALDPFIDLALIDISRLGRKPPPITLGSVDDLTPGDDLYVIGYPAPDEFTPLPTVDVGALEDIVTWEFTGVDWVEIEAPAIGGQSGGAVVDRYGRLVGLSTFGNSASLSSIAIDNILVEIERMSQAEVVRGLEPRALPHSGAIRRNELDLAGPWDQQLFLGWFLPDADVDVDWVDGSGELQAATISGSTIESGEGEIDFVPGYAFPVVVSASSDVASRGTLASSVPLIAYPDPDHGKVLEATGMTPGIYEVGGDRDFFYLDLDAGQSTSVLVESAARTQLTVYGPGGAVVAEDLDVSGFIEGHAAVEFTADAAGRYVVSLESALSTISGYTVVTNTR